MNLEAIDGGDGKVATILDFLDDYWYLQNVLGKVRTVRKASVLSPPIEVPSPRSEVKETMVVQVVSSRALRRTPSLPSPRIEREAARRDVESVPTESINPKLRPAYSTAEEHLHSSCSKSTSSSTPGTTRRYRPPRDIKTQGSIRVGTRSEFMLRRQMSCGQTLQEKKWRSLGDLECLEVQGFKDLGFVFDKDAVSANLANVIPGLRDSTRTQDEGDDKKAVISRPYLSEAWLMQRSAPPMVRWASGGRQGSSAEDMKEQLKFWARSVACNVRQEC